jgi:hypothetical protein
MPANEKEPRQNTGSSQNLQQPVSAQNNQPHDAPECDQRAQNGHSGEGDRTDTDEMHDLGRD